MSYQSFRTEITINEYDEKIEVDSKITFIGSCFAENIGKKAAENRLFTNVNPFGVLYNPVSIANSLIKIIDKESVDKSNLVLLNSIWQSFDYHGKFNDINPDFVVKKINEATEHAHDFLKHSKFLIITFGTSYVFQHKNLNKIVANCHKFPASEFDRYRLSISEIEEQFSDVLDRLRTFNPNLRVIFSVSPIRHLKDGLDGNQLSKAELLLAVEKLVNKYDNCVYFPSYEIMLDDLRDYRFYDASMIQPNNTAIEYIWEKFSSTFFAKHTKEYIKEVKQIVKGLNHKFVGVDVDAHQLFLRKLKEKIKQLINKYPNSNLTDDLKSLQIVLNNDK